MSIQKESKFKKVFMTVNIVLASIMVLSLFASFGKTKSPTAGVGGGNSSDINSSITNTIVGVSWNRSESTALQRLTTHNDNTVTTNITTEPIAGVGNTVGSSPFDKYYPWNAMKEYNVIDNEIAYSSDDAGFSRTAYDTVVYIPTFYYKVVDTEEYRSFYVSDKPAKGFSVHPGSNNYVAKYNSSDAYTSVSGATPLTNITRGDVRTNARAKGDKWSQYDFATWNAIQML